MHAPIGRETIGIIAGNGRLPTDLAERIAAGGRRPFIVGIRGEADPAVGRFEHRLLDWGRLGTVFKLFRNEGARRLLFVGGVTRRPELTLRHLDWTTVQALPSLVAMLASGDDTILSGVVAMFEREGFELLAVPTMAPELMLASGDTYGPRVGRRELKQIDLGADVVRTLGRFDVGQGAVVCGMRVVAVEGVEGTDTMLRRVSDLRDAGRLSDRRDGVLVKVAKPRQDLRVDLPTIGPRTIMNAAAAGLTAVACEAGTTIVLDAGHVASLANDHRIAVHGLGRP